MVIGVAFERMKVYVCHRSCTKYDDYDVSVIDEGDFNPLSMERSRPRCQAQ
jgi:hypothetical protein